MSNPLTKITRFSAILSILFFWSCNEIEYDTNLIFEKDGQFLYKTEKAFCQREPDNEIWRKTFEYDKNGNLTKEITDREYGPETKITSLYNFNNQPVTDSVFYFTNNEWKPDRYFKYKYTRNLLQEKRQFNADGTFTLKTVYKCSGTKLVWEEFYYFTDGAWRFQYAHKFEYNRSSRLIKKVSYQDESKEKVYDQFIYTYKNGKLATEKRILVTGETGYFKEYFYTKEGYLEEIVEDGNTVEKNYYESDKLIEKRTWYFGIDPGFSICSGNLIYKYEY
jgi:hypothetical protein